jgi:uncharacterized protein
MRMAVIKGLVALSAWIIVSGTAFSGSASRIPVLIVDGMNNHDWPRATKILKEILKDSGRFRVDVSTSPPANASIEAWAKWRPDFAKYAVVVSNFNGGHTPKSVVFIHANPS